MDKPICDFVRQYAQSGTLRLHMPGHKGFGAVESMDITEISGADSLYEAAGIIAKSEENASKIFGCPTFYSTEGASQCIRAMLHLASLHVGKIGQDFRVLAGRNAHKAFLSAAALLDFSVDWLYPKGANYLSCPITAAQLESAISDSKPHAVYLTSPDYLGNILDIAALANVCHRHDCLLLVDNAHGAYLKFTGQHPMDLGADLCCDSAHKTLPVLTGGAYLHVGLPALLDAVKPAMALFGSTSPSYLILQSLDNANDYLADAYPGLLADFLPRVRKLKQTIPHLGNEPLKLTVDAKAMGYTGYALADLLREQNIECEFADPDVVVLMLTPELGEQGLSKLETALCSIPRLAPITATAPTVNTPQRVLTIRQAALCSSVTLPLCQCEGKILADLGFGCPPAVCPIVCGERLDASAIAALSYYGIESCRVTQ